jgi:fucose 4-O-acetylase-like acetyltransferase
MARECYLGRIRVVLTAMVVLHHTAITYGAPGRWFYAELPATISLANLPFLLFVSLNQAYFMGTFFLIAGYFAPASCDRKGPARFLLDRAIPFGDSACGVLLTANSI